MVSGAGKGGRMAYQYRMPGKRPKYNNQKHEYGGHKFDSNKELARYKTLKQWQELGIISELRLQQTFVLTEKGKRDPDGKAIIPVKYIADFVYVDNETGKTIVEDVKGYRNAANGAYRIFKIKQKLMFDRFGIWVREV